MPVSACAGCPFRTMCRPEPPRGLELEEFARGLLKNAEKAKPAPHEGFGDPLPTLYEEHTVARGWNCVEKARAIVFAGRALGWETGYLLWIDDRGATHLTPVRVDEPGVLEEYTEHYWKMGYTPVAVFHQPPLNYQLVKISEPMAKNMPVLPPDEPIRMVEKLGYGEIIDAPYCLDTGVARVYRIRVQGVMGFLVWHAEDVVWVITKDPWTLVCHGHRLKASDFGVDTFRH